VAYHLIIETALAVSRTGQYHIKKDQRRTGSVMALLAPSVTTSNETTEYQAA